MSVCPTVPVLRFYGCCHPCFYLAETSYEHNPVFQSIHPPAEGSLTIAQNLPMVLVQPGEKCRYNSKKG